MTIFSTMTVSPATWTSLTTIFSTMTVSPATWTSLMTSFSTMTVSPATWTSLTISFSTTTVSPGTWTSLTTSFSTTTSLITSLIISTGAAGSEEQAAIMNTSARLVTRNIRPLVFGFDFGKFCLHS